ncbi:hypothetical protein CCACVL1_11805 [Corchorus capsularis]|uniref:Uncharacterized protein n=1 Tax=Corchorus capsularis TaxID=210143 RepID=A0A1R3IJB2_COCAP|nr:hypothetical protein CCACVL1_11805 [Corchorus capsularis]
MPRPLPLHSERKIYEQFIESLKEYSKRESDNSKPPGVDAWLDKHSGPLSAEKLSRDVLEDEDGLVCFCLINALMLKFYLFKLPIDPSTTLSGTNPSVYHVVDVDLSDCGLNMISNGISGMDVFFGMRYTVMGSPAWIYYCDVANPDPNGVSVFSSRAYSFHVLKLGSPNPNPKWVILDTPRSLPSMSNQIEFPRIIGTFVDEEAKKIVIRGRGTKDSNTILFIYDAGANQWVLEHRLDLSYKDKDNDIPSLPAGLTIPNLVEDHYCDPLHVYFDSPRRSFVDYPFRWIVGQVKGERICEILVNVEPDHDHGGLVYDHYNGCTCDFAHGLLLVPVQQDSKVGSFSFDYVNAAPRWEGKFEFDSEEEEEA